MLYVFFRLSKSRKSILDWNWWNLWWLHEQNRRIVLQTEWFASMATIVWESFEWIRHCANTKTWICRQRCVASRCLHNPANVSCAWCDFVTKTGRSFAQMLLLLAVGTRSTEMMAIWRFIKKHQIALTAMLISVCFGGVNLKRITLTLFHQRTAVVHKTNARTTHTRPTDWNRGNGNIVDSACKSSCSHETISSIRRITWKSITLETILSKQLSSGIALFAFGLKFSQIRLEWRSHRNQCIVRRRRLPPIWLIRGDKIGRYLNEDFNEIFPPQRTGRIEKLSFDKWLN